jgi:RNA-splicing ligase RtcB
MREAFGGFDVLKQIETHHNFAAIEQHLGKTVVVHRKDSTGDVVGVNSWGIIRTPDHLVR